MFIFSQDIDTELKYTLPRVPLRVSPANVLTYIILAAPLVLNSSRASELKKTTNARQSLRLAGCDAHLNSTFL